MSLRCGYYLKFRGYEEDISKHFWFKATGDEKAQQMQDELLKLRKFQCYALEIRQFTAT